VSIIHRTTLVPSKLDLLTGWLPSRPWYADPGREPRLAKAGGFRLDDPKGEVGIEFLVASDGPAAYLVPLTYRSAPLDGAQGALIGIMEHGVLGRRWAYDGTRDPVLVAQLAALVQGAAEPQAQGVSDTPDLTVLVHPLPGPGSVAGLLVPDGGLEASDGPDGTRIGVSVGPAGVLVVSVTRVLRPGTGEPAAPGGQVTATWQPAEGVPAVRGVFFVADLA
jgi:hypothetical protein